jgi:hypothetical protein
LYWLLGLLKVGAVTSNEVFNRSLFGSNFFNILESFALFNPFWTGGEITLFIVQPIPVAFFIVPIVALLGFLARGRNLTATFFALIALIGIFLTKQEAAPLPDVYPWLYQHFPGFNAFREASKFYVLTMLGFSILIGLYVKTFSRPLRSNRIHLSFAAITIFVLLSNSYPLISSTFKGLFVNKSVPVEYTVFKDALQSDPNKSRSLWVPFVSRWGFYDFNSQNIGSISANAGPWTNLIKKDWPKDIEEQVTFLLEKKYAHEILATMNIGRVVVPIKDLANDDNAYEYYGEKN